MKHAHAVGKTLRNALLAPMLLAALMIGGTAQANDPADPVNQVIKEKPFADARVALQISDPNPFKQTLVLNVAHNLLKFYGPDRVDIEVVAFGPGLRLLFADNAQAGRIATLADQGVRFSACKNTITNMGKKLGHEPALNPNARIVPAGIVRLIKLNQAGYFVAKP
ncbi:hypothetical protein GM160_03975 [Guyparkeria halophila]|uniref:Sulfur reduction protein DsrE n=1 Tax=Guyparkeria halophila TaxID=47960 RepID=A0A6I6CXN1_9GAMM|nr:hypothetical protein [Guyparkeria halophila]QGT78120.1 hypothetical protein GM160_03975 [Guyparkeria halophila]